MKLTEEQIWKCNQTINYEGGEVVDAVHICVAHQNVIDFARSIEREIGFDRAELWIKRINDAVLAEREACAEICKKHADFYAGLEPSPIAQSAWAACVDNRDTILARGNNK